MKAGALSLLGAPAFCQFKQNWKLRSWAFYQFWLRRIWGPECLSQMKITRKNSRTAGPPMLQICTGSKELGARWVETPTFPAPVPVTMTRRPVSPTRQPVGLNQRKVPMSPLETARPAEDPSGARPVWRWIIQRSEKKWYNSSEIWLVLLKYDHRCWQLKSKWKAEYTKIFVCHSKILLLSENNTGLVLEYKIIGSLSKNIFSALYLLMGIGIWIW